jgi:hypothetical protein
MGDSMRMDVGELAWKILYLIHVAQDMDQWRDVVYTVVNFRVP